MSLHPHPLNVLGVCPLTPPINAPGFGLTPFDMADVHIALYRLDLSRSARADNLEPFFMRSDADFIAKPLCHIYNIRVSGNMIPAIWKSAYVLPLKADLKTVFSPQLSKSC